MIPERAQSWAPLYDGDDAERARRVVLEIAEVLRGSRNALPFPDGPAARALFFGYLARQWPDSAWGDAAGECLEAAIEQLADEPMDPFLFHGFVGTAWVVEHLQADLTAPDDDDLNQPIDEALLQLLAQSPWRGKYELMHGLTGLGIYASARVSRPSARACLELVVQRLDELALARDGGITWLTRVDQLAPEAAREHPQGRFTLGAAHGVPGTIALLALACEAGVAVERARPLLDGAVTWLLAQRLEGAPSLLPRTIDAATGAAEPSRVAWCFGDAGAGASLLWAARTVDNRQWEQAAIEILKRGAAHDERTAGVVNAGFCHGAAGLAHLFNRAQQATGDPMLRAAALAWLERTLAQRRPGERCAGYVSEDAEPAADESFLSGIAGIGLVLLAATSRIEPAWDRLFACAVSPR